MSKSITGTKAPGANVPRETVAGKMKSVAEKVKSDEEALREFIKNDAQRCVSLLMAIVENEAILDELVDMFKAQLDNIRAKKEQEGKL